MDNEYKSKYIKYLNLYLQITGEYYGIFQKKKLNIFDWYMNYKYQLRTKENVLLYMM